MSTSERILNCSVALSPQAKRWGQVIQQFESELLRIVAYGHRLPIPNEPLPEDEVMKAFEGHAAVDGVRCDLDLAQAKFLSEIGIPLESIAVIDI